MKRIKFVKKGLSCPGTLTSGSSLLQPLKPVPGGTQVKGSNGESSEQAGRQSQHG